MEGRTMDKVSVAEIKELMEWFRKPGVPDLSSCDADTIWLVLEQLLAFREGYDPAERLPEDGELVLLRTKQEGYATGRLVPSSRRKGELEWAGVEKNWRAALGYAVRWYPLPSGEVAE